MPAERRKVSIDIYSSKYVYLRGDHFMEYKLTAKAILAKIGGSENVISAAHCATRLRLAVYDDSKCNVKGLEDIEGVKGVFFASGQLQIILGTGTVDKVYREFIQSAGIGESSKEDVRKDATAKQNVFNKAIRILGDVFVPIIPAIVASGFLMGIMETLNFMVSHGFLNMSTESSLYVFATIFANTAYTFLPILIAFSAGRTFGANPFLAAVIGMIMVHPDLQNAWTVVSEGVLKVQPVFFGLYDVALVGYQGHVIPVIIAVWVLSLIEKKLHKVVPAMIDLFVTPLVSVFVTGYLTLAVIGPVFVSVENGIISGIQTILSLPLGIGSLIIGALYAVTVVCGIHHMYTTIDITQIGNYGVTYWLPLASAANVAQGAAALAVGLKSKDKKVKALALPSSLSAFLGITEPAIFGVNLRYLKPFVCACIGGGCGAMYASIVGLGASGTGITGIFAILLHLHNPINYVIAMLIAAGVSFVLTWFFGYKDSDLEKETVKARGKKLPSGKMKQLVNASANGTANIFVSGTDNGTADAANGAASRLVNGKADGVMNTPLAANSVVDGAADDAGNVSVDGTVNVSASSHADVPSDDGKKVVCAPVSGHVIAMKDVGDPTFASEMLGKGVAIIPEEGKIVSPVDGKLAMLFPTKHALGITTGNGVEILVHIGINTVALEGKYFTAHVETGDVIKKGQLLMEFDMEAIKAEGYEVVTPVIITNSDEYTHMDVVNKDHVDCGDALICLY